MILPFVVDIGRRPVQLLPTSISHNAPMMSGPSPSPSLHEEQKIRKKWKCIECNQVFTQSKLLETHAADTDHKAYRCTKEKACGKVFTLRSSWLRHERSHSAEKAHTCYRCAKEFIRKDHCHGHERTCGRVARRARMSSKSTSVSPTTTTSSGTTKSGTPVDLLTTMIDNGDQCHATEIEYKGLLSLGTSDGTSDASHQKDNGHDDEKAPLSVSRGISVPTKSSPVSPAACLSTTAMAPTKSRSATLQNTVARPLPEPDLPIVDNIDNHTVSHNTTPQPHAGSDWRHHDKVFQGPDHARSPNLQYAEEDWDLTPVTPRYLMPGFDFLENLQWDRPVYEDICATDSAHAHFGHNYASDHKISRRRAYRSLVFGENTVTHRGDDIGYPPLRKCIPIIGAAVDAGDASVQLNRLHDKSPPPCRPIMVADSSSTPAIVPSTTKAGSSIPHSSEPKPESTPRSKIVIFKAYIKAPFFKHKQ